MTVVHLLFGEILGCVFEVVVLETVVFEALL